MGNLLPIATTTDRDYSFDGTKLTTEERNISFLVVLEPLTPFLYLQRGKHAQSKLIQSFSKGERIPHLSGEDRSALDSNSDFLELFVQIEFYLNQILKLQLIDTFSIEQWQKLEELVGTEALSMRAKMSIIKRIDSALWDEIKIHLSDLQELRNNMSHNPVGPLWYKRKEIDWSIVDHDIVILTTNLLTAYKKRQHPILAYLRTSGIETDEKS